MKFRLHSFRAYLNRIYIAEYDDGILLLDGGSSSDYDALEEYIVSKLNRSLGDIKLIVVSHIHPDHCGAAHILKKELNIPIVARDNINLWYAGFRGFLQHRFDHYMAKFTAKRQGLKGNRFIFPRKLNFDHAMGHGEPIPIFSDWTVFHIPGHTEHHIVLYHREEKILYCGDCIVRLNDKILAPFPITDAYALERSYEFLEKLECKTYLFAHGGILESKDVEGENIFTQAKARLSKPIRGWMRFYYPLFFLTKQAHYKNSLNRFCR